MRKDYIIVFICCFVLSSCGCGPTFLYNWRPKPWIHPYVANTYTGLDTLVNINGYYVSQITDTLYVDKTAMPNSNRDTIVPGLRTRYNSILLSIPDSTPAIAPELKTRYNSIMFYNSGLCVSLSTRVSTSENEIRPVLDTLYSSQIFSNKYKNEYYKDSGASWGTYDVHDDTVRVSLIENLIGCDGTRKNVISKIYLISNDKQLKQIFMSNSNKEYGYEKRVDIPSSTFYPIENKRDSMECPYLAKKWFYKKDKMK